MLKFAGENPNCPFKVMIAVNNPFDITLMVVAFAIEPPELEPETLTDPDGVFAANTDVNAVEPPDPAAPLTTLNALSLWVVCFVHPVGAAVCWNSIKVPDGKDVVTYEALSTDPSAFKN